MAQSLNFDFLKYSPYLLRPSFIMPDIHANSINEVDWSVVRVRGVEGIIFDADQTLVEYNQDTIHPAISGVYGLLKDMFEDKMVVLSNYAGNKADDAHSGRGKRLESNLGIPVINSSVKKPNPIAYFEALRRIGVQPQHAAMVGDRLSTDIMGARIANLNTAILVSPFAPQRDPWYTQVTRGAEQALFRLYTT